MNLNLGCGTDHHTDALNVDAVPACNPDLVYDITEYPWPWDEINEIRMYHVLEHLPDMERALREIAATLQPGGRCIVKLPIGTDTIADPDHMWGQKRTPWTWQTPEFYCGKRHWDTDVNLTVKDKSVSLSSVHPSMVERQFKRWLWNWKLKRYGPGKWCFDLVNVAGEFTVIFQK